MAKEFRVKKGYRIIICIIAILFCLDLLRDAYIYFVNEISLGSFQGNIILSGCALVMVFFALRSNNSIYRIFDDKLAIRSFPKKEKHYLISNIEVVEVFSDRFPIIKIYFSNEEKITLMPIDNESEFIRLLRERLKALGKTWSFVKK